MGSRPTAYRLLWPSCATNLAFDGFPQIAAGLPYYGGAGALGRDG